MYSILPIQDKAEQRNACGMCEVEYHESAMAYGITIDGVFSGICQFSLSGGVGNILALSQTTDRKANTPDDFEPFFIALRAALNFIDLCGIHRAVFTADQNDPFNSPETNKKMLRMANFKSNSDGIPESDLTGLFEDHCKTTK